MGHCPICEKRTAFYARGTWLRDDLLCARCNSIPRARALVFVLDRYFVNWRDLRVHESSPDGASSAKFARECRSYTPSHYYTNVPPGHMRNLIRCENLEKQTFPDASFDMVVTQDVLEHVLDPQRAFAEIARTLQPGGCHVFTVPWYYWKKTLVRAVRDGNEIRHLEAPQYHGNPIDPAGALVVTEWGPDLCDVIYRASGMTTTVIRIMDRHLAIFGEFVEVFVSRKPSP